MVIRLHAESYPELKHASVFKCNRRPHDCYPGVLTLNLTRFAFGESESKVSALPAAGSNGPSVRTWWVRGRWALTTEERVSRMTGAVGGGEGAVGAARSCAWGNWPPSTGVRGNSSQVWGDTTVEGVVTASEARPDDSSRARRGPSATRLCQTFAL